jgi:hypothetical protein
VLSLIKKEGVLSKSRPPDPENDFVLAGSLSGSTATVPGHF